MYVISPPLFFLSVMLLFLGIHSGFLNPLLFIILIIILSGAGILWRKKSGLCFCPEPDLSHWRPVESWERYAGMERDIG